MVARVIVSPTLVRVSLAGVNAVSPPDLTESYLAIDSSWPKVERIHAIIRVNGENFITARTYSYASLARSPAVIVLKLERGTTVIRDMQLATILGQADAFGGVASKRTDRYFISQTAPSSLTIQQIVDNINGSLSPPDSTLWDFAILVFDTQ